MNDFNQLKFLWIRSNLMFGEYLAYLLLIMIAVPVKEGDDIVSHKSSITAGINAKRSYNTFARPSPQCIGMNMKKHSNFS